MIITSLKGGLGNQMFQYAAGRRLALFHNTDLKLDISFLTRSRLQPHITKRHFELSGFHLEARIADQVEIVVRRNPITRALQRLLPAVSLFYYKEKHFNFDAKVLTLPDHTYLDGHWMTDKYFADVADTIRSDFQPRDKPLLYQRLAEKIGTCSSVAVQVRRGDYVSNPVVERMYNTTSVVYFQKGITYIQERIVDCEFFVFSDDPKWCRENLKFRGPVTFVEEEPGIDQIANTHVMLLMASCNNFIISNSSFGWWGAWLGNSPDKIVIAPKRWFNDDKINTSDIYNADWIKL